MNININININREKEKEREQRGSIGSRTYNPTCIEIALADTVFNGI